MDRLQQAILNNAEVALWQSRYGDGDGWISLRDVYTPEYLERAEEAADQLVQAGRLKRRMNGVRDERGGVVGVTALYKWNDWR